MLPLSEHPERQWTTWEFIRGLIAFFLALTGALWWLGEALSLLK